MELVSTYYPKLRKVFRNLVSIKDVPISMTQLTCLNIINRQSQLTMSDLADELNMSNQQLTKVVDALEGFEMVERTYDPKNRRKIYAKVTQKGKDTLQKLKQELTGSWGKLCLRFPTTNWTNCTSASPTLQVISATRNNFRKLLQIC